MKVHIVIVVVICSWLGILSSASAQNWIQSSADTNYPWAAIASSADGTKLVAAAYQVDEQGVYVSTNAGASWVLSDALAYAGRIVCSADATKLAVEAFDGEQVIYTSTNFGSTWALSEAPPLIGNWGGGIRAMIGSANGGTLAIFYTGGIGSGIYVSTNWGTSWALASDLNEPWTYATCSADGTKMAAVINADPVSVLVSTNAGVLWQTAAPVSGQWPGYVLATADASKLMAATSSGLFISTDWGMTWSLTNAPLGGPIVCSESGSPLLGIGTNYVNGNMVWDVYTSTNLGATWTSNSLPQSAWNFVACSADGNELIATAGFSDKTPETNGIWISKAAPSPQLNLALAKANLNFSWIVPTTNMVLQQSPDLMSWITLTNAPSFNYSNLQEQVALPPGGGYGFFRLISQ